MKKMVKHIALLLSLAVLLTFLAACGGSGTDSNTDAEVTSDAETVDEVEVAEDDKSLTIGVTEANGTHDLSGEETAGYEKGTVYEYLFKMNKETQEAEPWLAESYEWVDDLTLKIKLRDNVYFTNGQKLCADDVMYSYQTIAQTKSATYWAKYDFENSYIEDDLTIVFKFTEHYSPAINFLCLAEIVCAEDYADGTALTADEWLSSPNGTGPYYCVENVPAAYVTYERKDAEDYWGELPECTSVTYKYYSETTTMYIDFENGDLDVAYNIGQTDAERVISGDCTDFTGYSINNYNDVLNIVLPEESEIFDDIRVREAFFMSIDAESIGLNVYGSLYQPADSILASTLEKYYEAQDYPEYDPEGAKELLAEAGYEDGVSLRLIVTSDLADVAEALQGCVAAGGFDVTVESYDFATAIGMIRNMETDFAINQVMDGAYSYDPAQAMPITWGPNSTYVPIGMDDEVWAEYFNIAMTTTDEQERIDAYHKLQEWAAEEYRFYPVLERCNVTVYNTEKLASFDMLMASRPVAESAVFN